MTEKNFIEAKNVLVDFIKKSITMIINSRIGALTEIEELLSLRTKIKKKSYSNLFDLDNLFLDEYEVLTFAKSNIKQYIIDIFCRKKNKKLLIERWTLSYFDEPTAKPRKYFIVKLQTILKTIYTLLKFLPYSSLQLCDNEVFYKFYQNQPKESFLVNPKKILCFNFSNQNLMDFSLNVKYVQTDAIKDFYRNDENIFDNNIDGIRHRPRFFSESMKKKTSFEILNYDEEKEEEEEFNGNTRRKCTNDYFAPCRDKMYQSEFWKKKYQEIYDEAENEFGMEDKKKMADTSVDDTERDLFKAGGENDEEMDDLVEKFNNCKNMLNKFTNLNLNCSKLGKLLQHRVNL